MSRSAFFNRLVAAMAAASLSAITGAHAQEVKIGLAAALTGPASFVGTEIKRGAEIAIDEINAKGGVKGRKLVLIARDDEHNPVKTVAQYRELVEREKVVAMLGASNSASMLAVTPIVNDTLKVPVICPATDATEITENEAQKKGNENYLFRVGMYGTGQANFMVDTMVKKFGHKKIGLLNWTGGWGVTGRGELNRRLKEHGLTPVGDETFDNNDTDMTAQIIKLKNAGAVAVVQARADWGVAIEPVAKLYGLDFLPIAPEQYDFLIVESRRNRAAVQAFLQALQDQEVRDRIRAVGMEPVE
jgi:branched-chain amino acid transport system substrate-binding protein